MSPLVKTFFEPATSNATHVVADPASKVCAVIDCVLDFDAASGRTATRSVDRLIDFVKESGFRLDWVLETHIHADHLTAARHLKERLGGRTAIGARVTEVQAHFKSVFGAGEDFVPDGSQFDHLFPDGEIFSVGGIEGRVFHTPGHTPACVAYQIGDAVFTGDSLFMPDSGTARCDFPGGSARALYRSIRTILELPPATRMFVNHDYGAGGTRPVAWETTVADQRAGNIHVRNGVGEDEFVAMRDARDKTLDMPALILPAIQVNMRGGQLPPPEENGARYLKIPLNLFGSP